MLPRAPTLPRRAQERTISVYQGPRLAVRGPFCCRKVEGRGCWGAGGTPRRLYAARAGPLDACASIPPGQTAAPPRATERPRQSIRRRAAARGLRAVLARAAARATADAKKPV